MCQWCHGPCLIPEIVICCLEILSFLRLCGSFPTHFGSLISCSGWNTKPHVMLLSKLCWCWCHQGRFPCICSWINWFIFKWLDSGAAPALCFVASCPAFFFSSSVSCGLRACAQSLLLFPPPQHSDLSWLLLLLHYLLLPLMRWPLHALSLLVLSQWAPAAGQRPFRPL